jgi:MFS family permease
MESVPENSGQTAGVLQVKPVSPARKVLGNRNFQLLWLGQGTSLIGDQFYLIALPWLVLLITGDVAQLGLVLALTGVPRVVFMLFGGALSDRFSQRSMMLVSDALRLVMTAMLAVIVFSGGVQLWMLYLFALAFGTVSGVFIPASQSMVPRIVGKDELMVGNTIQQVTNQLSVFVGPLLAGGLIAYFAGSGTRITGSASPSLDGIGLAFAIDAFTFLVSIATLAMMKTGAPRAAEQKSIVAAIGEGIAFIAKSRKILLMFLIMALINFLFTGPAFVGIPVLAKDRLPEGAAAYGLLMAALAIGTLIGALASGVIKVKPANIGFVSMGCIAFFGVGMAALGMISATWEGMASLFVIGCLNGYIGIVLVTLLQKSTPPEMMGRVMSLVMIAGMGLVPVSQAVSGFVLKVSFGGVFAGCGVLIVLIAATSLLSKDVKDLGLGLD